MDDMLELFIRGAVIAGIVAGGPKLWKLGKRKKAEAISDGEVYYGLLYYRVLLFYILGVVSAEMILMVLFGNSIEGSGALLMTLLGGVPFAMLYTYLYKKNFIKKCLQKGNVETETLVSPSINISPTDAPSYKHGDSTFRGNETAHSLSEIDTPFKKYGDFATPANDLMVQKQEPTEEKPKNRVYSTLGSTQTTEQQVPSNAPLFCRKCGTQLLSDSVYCNKCGTKVEKFSDCAPTENQTSNDTNTTPPETKNNNLMWMIVAIITLASILAIVLAALLGMKIVEYNKEYNGNNKEDNEPDYFLTYEDTDNGYTTYDEWYEHNQSVERKESTYVKGSDGLLYKRYWNYDLQQWEYEIV